MYLLDTNICIYAMKDKFPQLTKKLFEITPTEICISSVTVGELAYGVAKSKQKERSKYVLDIFLSAYNILPFDEEDAIVFGKIRALLNNQGTPIGPYDLQIASQGVSKGLVVVTHNVKEFCRIPNLNFEDWVISL
ncbi:MAG: type II toxin-antitoxin system VapC family toxin [Selenomonadaceae bacterium]|nr:type II toxin-antitoxin system VapC family toxin [Selenomonadaceae bacterium]